MEPSRMRLMMEKIRKASGEMSSGIYCEISRLNAEYALSPEPISFYEKNRLEYKKILLEETWSEQLWDCAWFHFTGEIPKGFSFQDLCLGIDIDGEGCIFDENGTPIRGITNVSSKFDRSLGFPGKRFVPLVDLDFSNTQIDFWMDAGNNDLFGEFKGGKVRMMGVYYCNRALRDLFYDYKFLFSLAESMDVTQPLKMGILYALEKVAINITATSTVCEINEARKILKPYLDRKGPRDPALTFYAVGHSHLDLAWLWPLRETKRKAARTFSTALANISAYNDYIYGASQPQQFEWIKKDYPNLFKKIKEAVAAGRIEVQGGMWVEADTNLTGGESLIRQFYYGKKFWKEEFGKEVDTLWLPDVFGFSGALPQIMKGCGCNNFLTIKLSWNMVNKFPYHSFRWKGIDGSEVLVHMPPEGTYNSSGAPKAIAYAAGEYSERGLSENAMMLYGIGDGGGGPGREHLEYLKREKDVCGLYPVKNADSVTFFTALRKEMDKLPEYRGEIYLERHQGTYTSQSKNKFYNRLAETALGETEFSYVLKGFRNGYTKLDEIWKEVLLYQFHDIIPGSSINRVYNESEVRYKNIIKDLNDEIEKILYEKEGCLCALNTTSFEQDAFIKKEEKWFHVKANPYAVSAFEPVTEKGHCIAKGLIVENEEILAEFNNSGNLLRLYDKKNRREAITKGNILHLYNDSFDAWDTYLGYKDSNSLVLKANEINLFNEGFCAGIEFKYDFGNSHLIQRVSVCEGSRSLRFDNCIKWSETKKMLRVDFIPNIFADEATFDIQFGNLKRTMNENNSHEIAQYEVCAHKWVDVSERDYGVALINDSKYGYRAKNGIISMNLLRSQMYPCVDQDKGEHKFSYALLPHLGDAHNGEVAKEAYAMNRPLRVLHSEPTESLIRTDNEHAIIETVKPAYDGKGFIVRIYNDLPVMMQTTVSVEASLIYETDLLENNINLTNKELRFRPFEIKTLRILK